MTVRSQVEERKLWVNPDHEKKKRRRRGRRRRHAHNRNAVKCLPAISFTNTLPVSTNSFALIRPEYAVSLDCEMVGVGEKGCRSILARVAVVDWYGNVLLNTFVQPTEAVTEYRTFVSGVRPEDVHSPEAMPFAECRFRVGQLVANTILVGHGLANDLSVLRYSHPCFLTRDSATYEPFLKHGYRPKRLKELAFELLGIEIQVDGHEHCPVEDAHAAMRIYKTVHQEWDYAVVLRNSRALHVPLRQLHK